MSGYRSSRGVAAVWRQASEAFEEATAAPRKRQQIRTLHPLGARVLGAVPAEAPGEGFVARYYYDMIGSGSHV